MINLTSNEESQDLHIKNQLLMRVVKVANIDPTQLTTHHSLILLKTKRNKGNYIRNNIERIKREITPPFSKEDNDDDSRSTHSVISIINDQGRLKIVNQYKLLKFLGQGSFGKVHLWEDCNTSQKFAIKILDKKKTSWTFISRNQTVLDNILNEINIMKKLNHQNVVKLNEVLDNPGDDTIYIVMEFVGKNSIYK